MPNYIPLKVQTKKITDSRINRRKNKIGTVAWPKRRVEVLRLGVEKTSQKGSQVHLGVRVSSRNINGQFYPFSSEIF